MFHPDPFETIANYYLLSQENYVYKMEGAAHGY